MSRSLGAAALLAVAVLVACSGEAETHSAPTGVSTPSGELCEHGVLGSLCPECHPALAAIYQGHGDWCAEHAMPESICPICHPERGGRPTATIDEAPADDGAATDGTRVTLASADVAARMGLETTALEAPSTSVAVRATARLTYDLSRVARLGARVPGIVGEVRVDVGQRVSAGDALAWIDSTSVAADRSRLAAALARRTAAEASEVRLAGLRASGISSERDLLAARQEAAAARSEHDALRASLRAVGGGGSSRYAVSSPIDGIVTVRSAVVGSAADAEDVLFEVVDASQLWAELAIPERDAMRVGVGQSVSLRVLGLDDRTFDGALAFVSPEIDPHTRTVAARAAIANPEGVLRVHALADAEIAVPSAAPGFVVPRAAVQHVRDVAMIFVRVSDVAYEVRRVEVLGENDDTVVVSGRLAESEVVVTTGSFLLRTETMRDSIGAGCCEADE